VRTALTARTRWCDDVATAARERCPEVLGAALGTALDRLTSRLGPEGPRWAWGAQHPARFRHALFADLGPLGRWTSARLPRGGDDTTIDAASPSPATAPPLFPSDHGVSYRQIVDLAAPARSRFVAAGGQVGHPLSAHYRDLLTLWHKGGDIAMTAPRTARHIERLRPR
jgi:penicillin amidase